MQKLSTTPLLIVLVLALSSLGLAQDTENGTYTVNTYECIGVYHQAKFTGDCQVRYREQGADAWRRGLDLVYDERDGQYRGSLVNLEPDTEYEIELSLGDSKVLTQGKDAVRSIPGRPDDPDRKRDTA